MGGCQPLFCNLTIKKYFKIVSGNRIFLWPHTYRNCAWWASMSTRRTSISNKPLSRTLGLRRLLQTAGIYGHISATFPIAGILFLIKTYLTPRRCYVRVYVYWPAGWMPPDWVLDSVADGMCSCQTQWSELAEKMYRFGE